MKNATPLWMSEEDEGTGDSIERLVMNQDYKAIALLCEEGTSLPKRLLPNVEALHVAKYLAPKGFHLQPDGSDYWYVEHRRPYRISPHTRRRAGAFKAVQS